MRAVENVCTELNWLLCGIGVWSGEGMRYIVYAESLSIRYSFRRKKHGLRIYITCLKHANSYYIIDF